MAKNREVETDGKEDIIYQPLNKKMVAIHVEEWDWDVNLDELLRIDYSNIFGEIITIPVLENQAGRLAAQIKNYYKSEKMKMEIKEAEVRHLYRNEQSAAGAKAPSIQMVDDYVMMDPIVKSMRYRLLRLEKEMDQIEVLYESVKSKSFKLNNLSKSVVPAEYEKDLVEGKINNVMIHVKNKRYVKP